MVTSPRRWSARWPGRCSPVAPPPSAAPAPAYTGRVPHLARGGFDLHYDVAGAGFPLFLVPGAAADATTWRRAGFVSLLEEEYTCILVDPPGIGPSSTPADAAAWAVDAIAEDVVALADHLGHRRFALWGASSGGSIAIVVAAEHPDRVTALVLSGAWPGDLAPWREAGEAVAAQFRSLGGPAGLRHFYAEEGAELPAWFDDAVQDGEMAARLVEGQFAYDWTRLALPEQLRVPTLVLVGEKEDPTREADAAAARMRDGQAVSFAGLGHVGVWPGAPDESVAAVLPFLRRATGTRPQAAG